MSVELERLRLPLPVVTEEIFMPEAGATLAEAEGELPPVDAPPEVGFDFQGFVQLAHDAVVRYGHHLPGCTAIEPARHFMDPHGNACSCGYADALFTLWRERRKRESSPRGRVEA